MRNTIESSAEGIRVDADYFFYPEGESNFKESANGKFVHTLIYKPSTNEIVNVFSRNVGRVWKNSCKNEVETDHRIRKNSNLNEEDKYRAYSWISDSQSNSALSILLHIFQKMNKKILLVAIGLLFVFTAFAKDCPRKSTQQSIKELELSCRAIVYHNNGNVALIENFKNGKQEGEGKLYHENGKLAIIGNYKNGEREGKWKLYRKNGKLEEIGNYKNGKQEGEWKHYHENGELKGIGNYKNGKAEGEWKFYHNNGKLKEIRNYKNGKEEGERKAYHNNGKLEQIGNFKNGKPEGEWKGYHNNGKLEKIGNFKNGKAEGEWKFYHENGKLEQIGNYKNGKQVSVENF